MKVLKVLLTRVSIMCALFCVSVSSVVSAAGVPAFPSSPSNIISSSNSVTWRYKYSHDYSAHTNGAYICGKMMPYLITAASGSTACDYRLIKQIQYNLGGSACLVAAGGYGAQHERLFTGSCAVIRYIDRLWNQLSADEQHKVDLLMKAALVASAYTTSDTGNASSQNRDLMGGTNLGRGWNPNFREGMIGMMIVGTIYLGGADAAYDFLDNYDHAAFTAQLQAAGLTNTYITFNYKVDNPSSYAPSGSNIEYDINDYHYMGYGLDELMEIYWYLTCGTYDRNVNTGLYGGAGINGAGAMLGGQSGLPNVGEFGMLHEFDGTDGSGLRSSVGYAYDGFRPNLVNQFVMIANGYWQSGDMADECISRMDIGIEDLFYKLQYGYYDYSKGHAGAKIYMSDADDNSRDFYWTQSAWYDAISLYHQGLLTCADAGNQATGEDSSGDGYGWVTLDGSASSVQQGLTMASWQWSMDGSPIATGESAQVYLPIGEHEITLTVTDSEGKTSTDTMTATVTLAACGANAGSDITVTADASGTASVTLDGSLSFSRDGMLLLRRWTLDGTVIANNTLTPTVELGVGVHDITLDIGDTKLNSASDNVIVTVEAAGGFTPGDANGDGSVDLDDFIVLKQNYGIDSGASWAQGDFNGDGAVDLDDFILLKQNYGN